MAKECKAPQEGVVAGYRQAFRQDDASLSRAPSVLPQPGTPFFGREHETARIAALLLGAHGVVTITGVAGVGKSRIALATAERVRRSFEDGVRYIGVNPFADVRALIAHAGADEDLQMLLVLDGADAALQDARSGVDAFRAAHPRSSVLVASRTRLGAIEERTFIVQPFALPPPEAGAAAVARTPAVAFFSERAALASPSFTVDIRSAPDVITLCAALDGLPLALELAAAQLRFLSLRDLAERVGKREFAPTSLDATLRGTIAILGDAERRLFHRLAVFEAPWTMSEAEAVCGRDGFAPADVFPAIVRMLEWSLLQTEIREGVVRYRYLETVRRVALRAGKRDREAARARAVRWYADEMLRPGLDGIPDSELMALLSEHHDALCCVLDRWCRDPALVLRCIASSRKYWEWRGHSVQSLARIEANASAAADEDEALRFAVARTITTHALLIGDNARAQQGVNQLMDIAAHSDDPAQRAEAWHNGAILAYNLGRIDHAEMLLERAAALHAERGAQIDHARIVMNLAAIDLARRNWERAEARLSAIEAVPHAPNEAVFLYRNRAYAAAMRDELVAAREFAGEAMRLCADPAVAVEWRVEVEHVLGIIAHQIGDYYASIRHQQRALTAAPRLPFRLAAFSLEDGAVAAFAIGRLREAAQLLAFVDAERKRTGQSRSAEFDEYYAARRREIAAAIGSTACEYEVVGASLTLARATELLLSLPSEAPKAHLVRALSGREREVAALIAKGKTNREIAESLAISAKTVENHLASIFAKLEASRRAQVAVMIREAQLDGR